jgi:hypothetical protein
MVGISRVLALALVFAPPTDRSDTLEYWLSAEPLQAGDPASLVRSLRTSELTLGEGKPAPEDVPGELVGKVAGIEAALRWVARVCFPSPARGRPEDPTAMLEHPAPAPWSGSGEHLLAAVVVTGARGENETRPIDWPSHPGRILPEGSDWTISELAVRRAPLFGAPSPRMPIAAQRFRSVHDKSDVYALGWVDRCEGSDATRRCLRWAQVVVRQGNRFIPGYLPAHQLVPEAAWIRPPSSKLALPRAALQPFAIVGSLARYVAIIDAIDGTRHRVVLEAPTIDDHFPAASSLIEDSELVVKLEGRPKLRIALDPRIDRFTRD